MKKITKILIGMAGVLILLCLVFVVWGNTPAAAMDVAVEALTSDKTITVDIGDWLIFRPDDQPVTTGYIFYPGGRVDYRAYAPYARSLALEGYLVVIPKMPLNLAVFGVNTAEKVIQAYPEIENWVIGGHSLGGSMAASYLYSHPTEIDGLILLASYPAESNDLSNYDGEVLSISGSLDGLATPDKITASVTLLPPQTKWLVIEGGNHAYFGWYGDQKGDNQAVITREEQQSQIIQSSLQLLDVVNQE